MLEFANELTLEIWRKGVDVVGRPLEVVMPELIGQGIIDLIKNVYNTEKNSKLATVSLNIHELKLTEQSLR